MSYVDKSSIRARPMASDGWIPRSSRGMTGGGLGRSEGRSGPVRRTARAVAIMSFSSYIDVMSPKDKPLVWLEGELRTPPLSSAARIEAGYLLRRLQAGGKIGLPHSRPMPDIGKGCHELRIVDETASWRIFYAIDPIAIVILGVEQKKTQATPKHTIDTCRRRIAEFRRLTQ